VLWCFAPVWCADLASMSHRNVVRYYISFVAGHHLWVVTEFADCGSCGLLLRGGVRLAEDFIAAVLLSVLRGVEYRPRDIITATGTPGLTEICLCF
jgi:hypothetical protein